MIKITISLIVTSLRIFGVKTEFFQACAHLFLGYLFGSYICKKNKLDLYLIISLTVVETICFLVGLIK